MRKRHDFHQVLSGPVCCYVSRSEQDRDLREVIPSPAHLKTTLSRHGKGMSTPTPHSARKEAAWRLRAMNRPAPRGAESEQGTAALQSAGSSMPRLKALPQSSLPARAPADVLTPFPRCVASFPYLLFHLLFIFFPATATRSRGQVSPDFAPKVSLVSLKATNPQEWRYSKI